MLKNLVFVYLGMTFQAFVHMLLITLFLNKDNGMNPAIPFLVVTGLLIFFIKFPFPRGMAIYSAVCGVMILTSSYTPSIAGSWQSASFFFILTLACLALHLLKNVVFGSGSSPEPAYERSEYRISASMDLDNLSKPPVIKTFKRKTVSRPGTVILCKYCNKRDLWTAYHCPNCGAGLPEDI